MDYHRRLRVFLCHASADKPAVRKLYASLQNHNLDPWLDEENLLPGQQWRVEIPRAVRAADAVIICLSRQSINKEGYVQKEIKIALDAADEKPEGTIFLVPLRLEPCDVPERLLEWQWVNLFDEHGQEKLFEALRARAASLHQRHLADPSETPPPKGSVRVDITKKATRGEGSTTPDEREAIRLAYLELWVSNECTELRVHPLGDVASDKVVELVDQYTQILEDKTSLIEALSRILIGLFGAVPPFKWNRSFRLGPFNSLILPFTLQPGIFAKTELSGCTLNIYPYRVEIDLWDAEGGTFNYIEHPLDSIGINFDAIGEGTRRLASILALRNATEACWPILRMDDSLRGFPFLQMDLI